MAYYNVTLFQICEKIDIKTLLNHFITEPKPTGWPGVRILPIGKKNGITNWINRYLPALIRKQLWICGSGTLDSLEWSSRLDMIIEAITRNLMRLKKAIVRYMGVREENRRGRENAQMMKKKRYKLDEISRSPTEQLFFFPLGWEKVSVSEGEKIGQRYWNFVLNFSSFQVNWMVSHSSSSPHKRGNA